MPHHYFHVRRGEIHLRPRSFLHSSRAFSALLFFLMQPVASSPLSQMPSLCGSGGVRFFRSPSRIGSPVSL
jgi:hypothetical protein